MELLDISPVIDDALIALPFPYPFNIFLDIYTNLVYPFNKFVLFFKNYRIWLFENLCSDDYLGSKGTMGMADERKVIFQNLERLAAVLVETFGRNCEIAIHDFAKLPHSLVYVEGEITKRKPGAPVTDLVIKTLRREGNEAKNICNYKNTTKLGRILKSSTAFIRDSQNKIIGAFCINLDITDFLNSITLIENLTHTSNAQNSETKETFALSLNETVESLIDQVVRKAGKQPAVMTKEEKLELVSVLEMNGAFSVKGAVHQVATLLGVSKYTMYNYIKSVRSNKSMT